LEKDMASRRRQAMPPIRVFQNHPRLVMRIVNYKAYGLRGDPARIAIGVHWPDCFVADSSQ